MGCGDDVDSEFYGLGGFGDTMPVQMPGMPQRQLTWSDVLKQAIIGAGSGGLTAAQMAMAQQAQQQVNAGNGNQPAHSDYLKWILIGGGVLVGGILLMKALRR